MLGLNRPKLTLLLVSSIVISLQLVGNADEKLDGYSKSTEFEGFVRWQHSSVDRKSDPQLLKISFFPMGSDHQTVQFLIDESGIIQSRAFSTMGAVGLYDLPQMTAAQLTNISDILATLPPSIAAPNLTRLICISFRNEKKQNAWDNRIYDIQRLPNQVKELMEVTKFAARTPFRGSQNRGNSTQKKPNQARFRR